MLLSTKTSRLLAALVLGSFTLPAFAAGLPADVPATYWAGSAVANLVDKWQILGLSPEGRFDGKQEVSRYEVAEAMWRVARIVERRQAVDLSAGTGTPKEFGDVEAQHEAAVEALVNKYALMEGMPGGLTHRFAGHTSVTRYELAWILHQLMHRAEARKVAVTGKGPSLTYKDVPAGHWAGGPLTDLTQRYGLLIGYPDGHYKGNQPVTRYELAISLNAALGNLLEKQFLAQPAPVPAKPAAKPEQAPMPSAKPPLPGSEFTLSVKGGRHDDRDWETGAGFDLGWWFGKVGGTRPGLALRGDYTLQFNRAQAPLVHAGNADLELRWRFFGVDYANDPYLYLAAGYHGDIWQADGAPLYHTHGLGLTAAAGVPTTVWDLWLVGRVTRAQYFFPDMSFSQRLGAGQNVFVGLEKRGENNAGLQLGYYGTFYDRFATGGTGTFLPVNHGGLILGGHWLF